MSSTLTIRNLDANVKQKLRLQAALHGRAMEAEAREILTKAVTEPGRIASASVAPELSAQSACTSVRGAWKGRLSTDEILALTRGE